MDGQGRTLADQIAEKLMGMIREGTYQAGDKLPTEKVLCETLGAGRNTVREALKLLASRNVIVIRQGAGSYLSDKQGVADDPFGFSLVDDRKKLTRELLQVRAILEPPIAALAAEHATKKDVQELEEILNAMEDVMRQRGNYADLDVRFHSRIAESTHNTVMGNLIPVIGNGVADFAMAVGTTEYEQTMIAHRRIFEYIRDHRVFEAEQEMRFHLLYNNNRYFYGDPGSGRGLLPDEKRI